MIKTIQRRLDAILHWNISFVGGFLGGYAILSHAGVFGSAQTGNLMEMASNVRFMEWEELGLRLLATARDEKKMMQLASLRQASSFFQRIHLRAKRNQIPVSRHCFLKVPCCCVVGTPRRRGTIGNKILRKSGLWSVVA